MLYDWLRAGHILSVIAWMAGLLMYPRLLVYRIEGKDNDGLVKSMDIAVLRLQKIILSPAMHLVWTFGALLAWRNWDYLHLQLWFWLKIFFVVNLTIVHFYFTRLRKKIIEAPDTVSSRRLRLLNEIPFLIAIAVVILAVVEPFS